MTSWFVFKLLNKYLSSDISVNISSYIPWCFLCQKSGYMFKVTSNLCKCKERKIRYSVFCSYECLLRYYESSCCYTVSCVNMSSGKLKRKFNFSMKCKCGKYETCEYIKCIDDAFDDSPIFIKMNDEYDII
jgi:hypothetical protein